jgi:hypothetical protein
MLFFRDISGFSLHMFRKKKYQKVRLFLQKHFARWRVYLPKKRRTSLAGLKVLVVGIYLADRENCADHLVRRFSESPRVKVTQRWAALCGRSDDAAVTSVTTISSEQLIPKFKLLNQLLAQEDLGNYDFILFTDDDVVVPQGFLESYLDAQRRYDFALAQPARAWHSFYDHKMVVRKPWLKARETRFVEIGPVFSLDARAAKVILPFDESSPMGYGYDFCWPVEMVKAGLKMGIIDAVSVDHSFRPQGVSYSASQNNVVMERYLLGRDHLTRDEAMKTLRKHFL